MPLYFVIVQTVHGELADGYAITTWLGTIGAADIAVKKWREIYDVSDSLFVHVDVLENENV